MSLHELEQLIAATPRSLRRRLLKQLLPTALIGAVATESATTHPPAGWLMLLLAGLFGIQVLCQIIGEVWDGAVTITVRFSFRKSDQVPDEKRLAVVKS